MKVLRATNDEVVYFDAYERLEALNEQLKRTPKGQGKITWEGLFTPSRETEETVQLQLAGVSVDTEIKKARTGLDYDDVPMACIACSL